MNLKLSYLAIVIVAPIGIWNMLPWGGPTIASATAQGVEVNELFAALLPGLLAAQVVVILLAARLGFKERKRLGYTTAQGKGVSQENIQEMLKAIRDKDPELKRPKLFLFNLALTLAALVLLIQGEIHGSIIFMMGSAIALVVNYRSVEALFRPAGGFGSRCAAHRSHYHGRRCVLRSPLRKRHGNCPGKQHRGPDSHFSQHPHGALLRRNRGSGHLLSAAGCILLWNRFRD